MIYSMDVITGEVIELPDEPIEVVISAEDNKAEATYRLQQTDWIVAADVGNPVMSNPYLANQAEFIAYRNEVRQHAINPVEGQIDWPEAPTANWVTA